MKITPTSGDPAPFLTTKEKAFLGAIMALVLLGIALWLYWPPFVQHMRPANFDSSLGSFGDSFGPLSCLFSFLSFMVIAITFVIQFIDQREVRVLASNDLAIQERMTRLNAITSRIAAYDTQLAILADYPKTVIELLGSPLPPQSDLQARELCAWVAKERRALWEQLDNALIESGVKDYRLP